MTIVLHERHPPAILQEKLFPPDAFHGRMLTARPVGLFGTHPPTPTEPIVRLLTRADFDGLICAVLLREIGLMDEWVFVHPKDVQDDSVEVTENDILANVPYAPGCGMWFDHHSSESERLSETISFTGASRPLPSCARVIWEFFGGHERFDPKFDDMLEYVDRCDSGNLTAEEIEFPEGWILLSFIMDPRTGLGRYKDYKIGNYQLMMKLVELCRTRPVEEILADPDVNERVKRYLSQDRLFRAMLRQNTVLHKTLAVTDLRGQEEIFIGNRFVIFSMYPEADINLQIMWGKDRQTVQISAGHSILNRTSNVDVGSLLLRYGGGGHRQAGACQVPADIADHVIREIIQKITADQ